MYLFSKKGNRRKPTYFKKPKIGLTKNDQKFNDINLNYVELLKLSLFSLFSHVTSCTIFRSHFRILISFNISFLFSIS